MTQAVPSRTAMKIGRFMVLLDSIPKLRGVLPSDAAATAEAILRASGAVRARHLDMMRSPGTARFYQRVEKWLGQGQLLWFGVRKRWSAEAVEQAIQEGARQLLVVGAGFDPLAVLVARKHPEVLCVEIDAPVTAEAKRAGVEGSGLARPNHVVRAADLSRTSLEEALRATPWRTDARSVVVAEGLLMYLPPEDVARFFSQVRACTGPESRVAFTSLDADEHGRPRLGGISGPLDRFIRFALRLAGEPMHWGLSPSAAPAFLATAGFRALDQPTLQTLRGRFLDPLGLHEEPVAPYEHVVLAEVARWAVEPTSAGI